jgi:hypothetical protein
MGNKLFVTGLALGIENDACQCSNYNVDWLFNYPSTLLWAKKIIVTKNIWETITNARYYPSLTNQKEVAFGKAIKLIFEFLHSENIIEIVDIEGIITEDISNSIYDSIDSDIEILSKRYPQSFKQDEDGNYFKLNNDQYCIPKLWTIYAGLILSRYYNANGIFSQYELNYFDFKYRIGANKVEELKGKLHAFHNVLQLNLPNISIGHAYLFDQLEDCQKCTHELKCKDTYLSEIEKNIKSIIKKRDYDEIQQVINLLNKISEKRDFLDTGINRRVKSVFPKIKRWSNLTTFVSIPVALSGLITGNPFLTIPGGMVTGIAKGTEELLKYYENKYNWINFLNN